MFDPNPEPPFYLIVADHDVRVFCVEGPMTDTSLWNLAAGRAREHGRRGVCGPVGTDRNSLSSEFQQMSGLAGAPPGSIVRPRG